MDQLTLLEYAQEGVRTLIGTHPAPNEDAKYLDQLEADLAKIKKRIKKLELKAKQSQ